jgi:hypothetical protein
MTPLRSSFEQFGAKIEWEPKSKMVSILYNGNTLSAKLGETKASFNGETVRLIAPIQLDAQKSAEVSEYFVDFYQAKLSKTN